MSVIITRGTQYLSKYYSKCHFKTSSVAFPCSLLSRIGWLRLPFQCCTLIFLPVSTRISSELARLPFAFDLIHLEEERKKKRKKENTSACAIKHEPFDWPAASSQESLFISSPSLVSRNSSEEHPSFIFMIMFPQDENLSDSPVIWRMKAFICIWQKKILYPNAINNSDWVKVRIQSHNMT